MKNQIVYQTINYVYLIRLPNISEIEAGGTVWRVWSHSRHTTLIALSTVCWVTLIPDVDGDVLTLYSTYIY